MYGNVVFRVAMSSAAAAVTALILSACGSQNADTQNQAGDMGSMPGMNKSTAAAQASFNDADVAFAQMMIPDHQMTAKMAKLAQKKAASDDLKTLAADMQQGQSQAVDKLQGWLKTWGKPASAEMAGMGMPGAMTEKDMTMLETMGGMKFDMTFAQIMINHHKGSIQMAKDEQATGANAEAKAMAASMVKTQQEQIEKLQQIAAM